MKTYEEKPIPLILRNAQKKYQVNPQALQFFNSLQGKVAIISVAGIYRTGKSFLLNKMILNSSEGFAVGPTTNAKTKGIWVWGKPLISHNQNDQIINVVVLDSEGLGSTDQDINHDLKLFSITLLMSSAFLYNTVGSVDQNAIDSLGLVLRLCQHLKTESYNDFPDFFWILRDFSLQLVDKDNKDITKKQYLENCLSPQPGDSQIRNKIRYSIKQSFQNRDCITFVRPLTDESSLQNLDKMKLDDLRPQFVTEVINFRKYLFQNLKTKTIKGKQVRGQIMGDLISLYVSQINGDNIPVIETGWKYVCLKQSQNALQAGEKKLLQKLSYLSNKFPQTKSQFLAKKQEIEEQVMKQFLQKTKNNDQCQQSLNQLKSILLKSFNKFQQQMTTKNAQDAKNFVRKQFESVQKKLKLGEFSSIAELSKEFQLFYEYFRKKCPYKDHMQVGLQYLMKKFSDCGLIVFKSFKNKKDNQVSSLKEEVQKLTNQLIIKEEKFKNEKQKLNDRVTISESSLSNLQIQNKQYVLAISQLQSAIQILKSEAEQLKQCKQSQDQMQIITLKKKLLMLEDQLRQNECSKGLQINNLRNSLMLKQNQINHSNEQKNLLNSKLGQIEVEMIRLKQEKSKNIENLIIQLQTLKQKQSTQVKSYEEKLRIKNSQIAKLQNCLESKACEIQSLKSQKLSFNQEQLEQSLRQKENAKRRFEEQVLNLKQCKRNLEDELKLTSSKLQQQVQQKQMDLKMLKMQIEKQKAILEQKINFLKTELDQKQQKISKLQKQNKYYLEMYEEKDSQISQLMMELQNAKMNNQNSSEQITIKFNEYNDQLKQKDRQIHVFQKTIEGLEEKLSSITTQYESILQKHQKLNSNLNQSSKLYKQKIQELTSQVVEQKQHYQNQLNLLKQENSRNLEQQKRNIQISIIQLKNYYEMDKERLQKKLLQDRKKYENLEQDILQENEEKIKKKEKAHMEEINRLKNQMESFQDQWSHLQNEYQSKLTSQQEQAENQIKIMSSKYELLEKKYNDSIEEFNSLQTQTNQDRISFIKKIQMLNFQLSKKQKQLMQAISKKQSAENILIKKQAQIENIKKIMNQEIQNSLKKIQQTNVKYQKLNEQYLQFKIDCQKQLALCRQRNEFLTSKLSQLNKEKQVSSSKNLQKIDKQKMAQIKQQVQKYKNQNLVYESKMQTMKKQSYQLQNNYKKQISTLEKELQHQKQRLHLEKTKNADLQEKITNKNQLFKRELQTIKEKYQNQRNQHNRIIQEIKQKNSILEDEKNNISWKLQKQVALLNDKIQYCERQKQQAKKQLEESERRLMILTNQLKKSSQKTSQDQQSKKSTMDRRITQQLQTMKFSMKSRSDQQQEQIKKLREELKTLKQKNFQLNEYLKRSQKTKYSQKSLMEEKQNLLREKQMMESAYKQQKSRQLQEWRRKIGELQRTNKQLMNQNNLYIFQLQKSQSKWLMEKNSLLQKISSLDDQLEWIKNTNQMQRTSSKSRLDSSKRSDMSKHSSYK